MIRMAAFSIILSINVYGQTNININGTGTPVNINGSGASISINSFSAISATEGVVRSLGTNTYSAFPHTAGLSDGHVAMIFKESINHANAGPLMFAVGDGTHDGYNFEQISIDTPITCSNLGMGMGSNNRIIVDWQTTTAGPINFAYSDNRGATWTSATNSFTYPSGYIGAQFGKIIQLGGGGLLKFYYLVPSNPEDPTINGCLKSTDNGATWAKLADIAIRDKWDGGVESGNDAIIAGRGGTTEIHGVVTEMGESDATTKVVVLLRPVEHSGHFHYRSADGGATWERLSGTSSYFSDFNTYGPTVEGRIPLHTVSHNDSIYVFAGLRQSGNYRIAYTSVTPANFYNNTGYADIQEFSYEANADNNGSYIDFGYPEPLSRYFPAHGINEILVPFYDTSPSSSGSPRDMLIYQLKLSL